jgi:hypothetical protein
VSYVTGFVQDVEALKARGFKAKRLTAGHNGGAAGRISGAMPLGWLDKSPDYISSTREVRGNRIGGEPLA